MSDEFLFGDGPLIAGVCLAAALLYQLLVGSRGRAQPRERRSRGSVLQVALLGTFAGHLVMVAWPSHVLAWNRSTSRLLALESVLWLFGLLALGGLIRLVIRDMRDPAHVSPRSIAGTIWRALALVAVVSGLAMAVRYRWASSWSSLTLTPWLRSVLRLRPEPQLVDTLPYVVKLHLLTGVALLMLLPVTSAFHVMSAWLARMSGVLDARIASALRHWCGPLMAAARHTCRGLLHSESED